MDDGASSAEPGAWAFSLGRTCRRNRAFMLVGAVVGVGLLILLGDSATWHRGSTVLLLPPVPAASLDSGMYGIGDVAELLEAECGVKTRIQNLGTSTVRLEVVAESPESIGTAGACVDRWLATYVERAEVAGVALVELPRLVDWRIETLPSPTAPTVANIIPVGLAGALLGVLMAPFIRGILGSGPTVRDPR